MRIPHEIFRLLVVASAAAPLVLEACGSTAGGSSGALGGAGGMAGTAVSTGGKATAGSGGSKVGGAAGATANMGGANTAGGGAAAVAGRGATSLAGVGGTASAGTGGIAAAGAPQGGRSGTDPCAGDYLLCDDFNGRAVDTSKWTIGNTDVGHVGPVRPENIALGTTADGGATVTVVDASMFGTQHTAAPQGGLLITVAQYGSGRYEARMKSLPGPNGCTCLWNYYDSDGEASPPATRVYTEIDIEMPAHVKPPPAWATWSHTLGFNTWSHTDLDADATYINYDSPDATPFDGKFHVFRWDWDAGKKIDWYVDGVLQTSTTAHVSDHPAQLWVGNWPAPWPGMTYDFDVEHMYIDWVRISVLE